MARRKGRPSPSLQGVGQMAGRALGGLLVVGIGIGLGLLFGNHLDHAQREEPEPVAVSPDHAALPHPAAPEAVAHEPVAPPPVAPPLVPASGQPVVTAVVMAPKPPAPSQAPAPAPEPRGGEEPAAAMEPAPGPAGAPPVLFDVTDAPSLDLAALPPAMAVSQRPQADQKLAALRPPAPPEATGQPAWLRNAVAFPLPATRPMIALVFDDLGMDRKRTERVIGLPGPLTLSFLPYAGELPRQTQAARAAGHELLVHMPMEPLASGLDPGPGVLLTSLPPDEILRRLDKGLSAFDGYVGINNHMGSRFTSDRAAMLPVLGELRRRGLLFLDSVTIGSTVGPALAAALGLPNISRNVFLDDDLAPAAVQASLARLEQVARQSGMAVAIGHPHDVTLEAVAAWLPTLAAKGFALAPVSAVARARGWSNEVALPAADPLPITPTKGRTHG